MDREFAGLRFSIFKDQSNTQLGKYRLPFTNIEYTYLGESFELNGRQIKNSIVLARALAREKNEPLAMGILKRAVVAVVGESAGLQERVLNEERDSLTACCLFCEIVKF